MQQGDTVSACLFILCLEMLFTIVKNNKDIKSLKTLRNTFLYTADADDTTFFLKYFGSIKELLNKIYLFSSFSVLKLKLSKYEVARIGLLKGVKDAIKITGFFFVCVYNKNIELQQNLKKTIIVIEKVLRMWRRRNLTLEGKIIIFKTLSSSKFVFLAQDLPIPNEITVSIQ